jgi:Sec-independent protein translocase protein TatA
MIAFLSPVEIAVLAGAGILLFGSSVPFWAKKLGLGIRKSKEGISEFKNALDDVNPAKAIKDEKAEKKDEK